jgi:hypothetical protein
MNEFKKEKKKMAIVSYGTRIAIKSKNVRAVDLTYLRNIMQNVYGREVDYVTFKTDKDPDSFKNVADVNINDYDEVMIYNCSLNPFGGVFKHESIITIQKLMEFNGDIWYFLVDPKMPCLDFAAYLKTRLNKYGAIKIDRDPFEVTFTEEWLDEWTNKVWSRMKIAYGGVDYDKYYKMYTDKVTHNGKKEPKSTRLLNPNYEWAFVPLFEYYAVNEDLEDKLKDWTTENKKWDLIYFGNNRMTNRSKIIANFYDQENYHNYVLGYDPEFKKCDYDTSGYVAHDEMFKIIPMAWATLILGDELHNSNIRTPRFFEGMLLDTVGFIYIGYDEKKQFVKNKELQDFIYVSTPEELQEKVAKIKSDTEFYRHIVELERQEILGQFGNMKEND